MSLIQCKLRCMSVDHRHDKSVVEFYAVTDEGDDEENALFWKYTPSAQLTVEYPKGEVPELFTPDKTYYLFMCLTAEKDAPTTAMSDPEVWMQDWDIRIVGPESRQYVFSRRAFNSDWGQKHRHVPPYNGKLELQVDNQKAFDTLGVEGGRVWRFTFEKAPEAYFVYINGDHTELREPNADTPVTFEALVKASGMEGPVTVKVGTQPGKVNELVDPEDFEIRSHVFYVVTPQDRVSRLQSD